MNAKLCKRLRREANYHPSDKREYVDSEKLRQEHYKDKNGKTKVATVRGVCTEVSQKSSRSLYLELKREHRSKQA